MELDGNLKIALYQYDAYNILIHLKKQMGESGYNKQDLLGLISKTIEYCENFGEEGKRSID